MLDLTGESGIVLFLLISFDFLIVEGDLPLGAVMNHVFFKLFHVLYIIVASEVVHEDGHSVGVDAKLWSHSC